MKTVISWILIGFAAGLALALPPKFWIVVAIAAAAGIFAAGLVAVVLIIRGFLRALRDENTEPWRTD